MKTQKNKKHTETQNRATMRWSQRRAAAEFGVPRSRLQRLLKAAGIPTDRGAITTSQIHSALDRAKKLSSPGDLNFTQVEVDRLCADSLK